MAQKTVVIAYRDPLVANLKLETVDFQNVGNRRFMYNPNTGTFFLGSEDKKIQNRGSHAEEFGNSSINENFDDFIRGWFGYNRRQYKHGIIHFAPPICKMNFDKGFDSLLAFYAQRGIDKDTKVRGFISFDDVPMSSLLPNHF